MIEAPDPARLRLSTAVRDLKAIGFWGRLTDHLFQVELDARGGTANVPEDGHLADAYFTGIVAGSDGGAVCDIMFFTSAVSADLARWRRYYAAGMIAEAPPTMRAFRASILAHELGHCRRGPRGEAVAQSWEERARDALLAAGV